MTTTQENGDDWTDLHVSSEADAFRLIERCLAKELGYKPYRVIFDNWPTLSIKLEGEGYESTITPDMAEALVELQHAMNRSYARLVHDSANGRSLTTNERQSLKFKARVEKGSSLVNVDMGEWAGKLGTALINKMTPEELVVTVVSAAAVAGATVAYKTYLRHKSEDKKVDAAMQERIALSQEETKRQALLAQAIQTRPTLAYVREDFDVARTEVLKGVGDATTLEVAGIQLDNATASAVAKAKRTQSKELQLNGNYEIIQVNWQLEGEVRIKVVGLDNKKSFTATVIDQSLEQDQIALLKEAEWARSPIFLSINATELRGEITTATIVAVTPQPHSPEGQSS